MDGGRQQAVRIGLLGGVRAETPEGRPLDVGPARCQAVLATLALSPGRAVPVTQIVDSVWADDPPRTAEKTLQSYVLRLRRALGAASIARVGAAYRLDVDPDAVDVARFRRQLDAGDADGALAEWTGMPLAGLDAPGLAPVVDGLVERWLDAVEQRLADRVEADAAGTVGDLTQLTATHPFRERLWELLMRALYRAGRQADALDAFRTAREQLAEHLGVEPGPRLQELHRLVLAQDEELLAGRDGQAAAPAPPAPPPRRLGRLIGRDTDLRRVRDLLDRAPLVTLVGPGGVGKTRLALEAAAPRNGSAGDGSAGEVWFVELAQVSSAQDVPRAVAGSVGVREVAGRTVTESIAAGLAPRRGLLVLDNCEHVLDGATDVAVAVAGGCADVRVLATSREALGVGGEHVFAVAPLDPRAAGVELFTQRAAAVSTLFDPVADRRDVEEICARLDGLPLAIELAAARTSALTTTDIVARLDDRFRLLEGRRRDLDPRQRTLRAALQWSYDLLDADEQALFSGVSVFTGPFDAAAAHRVAAPEHLDVIGVDDELSALADRSLLTVHAEPGGRRYRMLETMRELGTRVLAETGGTDAIADRHARWCVEETTAARRLLEGPGELAGAARIDRLWPDVRAALQRALATGDVALADAVARPVASELGMRQRLEVGEWAERILALTPHDDGERLIHWLLWATQRHMERGDDAAFDALVDRYGHADHPLVAHARDNLRGDGSDLVASSTAAAAWLRAHDEHYLADWMEIVGVAAGLLRAGRFDEHDELATGLTERHMRSGPPTFVHWTLFMRGYSALFRGDVERAARLLDEAAQVAVPPGTFSANQPAEARAAFRRGDRAQALRLLHDHVVDLLGMDNNMVASRLVAIEFITMTAAVGRYADAACILGHLRTTGDFGAMAAATVVADAVAAIAADGGHAADEARGAELDHTGALVVMRGVLAQMCGAPARSR